MLALPSPVSVFAGVLLFGVSLPWILVGAYTLLQLRTPQQLQGRVHATVDTLVGAPQTAAIALGAGLVAVVDYRVLLVLLGLVVAVAGVWLATRREQRRPQRRDVTELTGRLSLRVMDMPMEHESLTRVLHHEMM